LLQVHLTELLSASRRAPRMTRTHTSPRSFSGSGLRAAGSGCDTSQIPGWRPFPVCWCSRLGTWHLSPPVHLGLPPPRGGCLGLGFCSGGGGGSWTPVPPANVPLPPPPPSSSPPQFAPLSPQLAQTPPPGPPRCCSFSLVFFQRPPAAASTSQTPKAQRARRSNKGSEGASPRKQ
jgi:hypothetical protein